MPVSGLLSSVSLFHPFLLLAALILYNVQLAIRRLWFSPISDVPGPKLAALTWWYEFYYDIVLGGQYTFQIIELHKQYGPVVRINPDEVHIGDPDFYPTLYAGTGHRREKTKFYVKQFGADESALATIDHDHHKLRRSVIHPLFSTQSVRKLQPVIEERVDALLTRLLEYSNATLDKPLDLMYPFSAFTYDVINEFAFARSDYSIEHETFNKEITDCMLTGTHYGKWIQHIEIILKLINTLPDPIAARFVPGWAGFLNMKRTIHRQIKHIKSTQGTPKWEDINAGPQPTIFHAMLSSPLLPAAEKNVTRLAQDGQILVQGGTLTTSWTLSLATFHLLNSPSALRKLRDELLTAIPDPHEAVLLPTLESLPYLRAVVKESLRLGIGTSGRLARVAPDEDMRYTDPATGRAWVFPPGTPVSMTTYKTVTTATLFPDPFGFHPERWLGDDGGLRLERYFTVFGGGTRVCLGMALAQSEMFLALAKMFRVWGGEADRRMGDVGVIKVYETTEEDCQMAADYFIPIPWLGSKGIRVVFESN